VEAAVSKVEFQPAGVPVAMIEIIPDKITNRLLPVPKERLAKFLILPAGYRARMSCRPAGTAPAPSPCRLS
jgi:hypothetical protein